jgi:hypothetical protein
VNFKPGDRVRVWKPGHAEHGAYGVVSEVEPRAPGDPPGKPSGDDVRCEAWYWQDGHAGWAGTLGDYMLCHEEDWQREERRKKEKETL